MIGVTLVSLGAHSLQTITTVATWCIIVGTWYSDGSEYSSPECQFRSLYFSALYNSTAGPNTLVMANRGHYDHDRVACLSQNYRHPDNDTLTCWYSGTKSTTLFTFDLYESEQVLIASLQTSAKWMIGLGSVALLPCCIFIVTLMCYCCNYCWQKARLRFTSSTSPPARGYQFLDP